MAEQKKFEPTVYSQHGFSNPDGDVERSNLSIYYWNNLIVLRIGMRVDGNGPTDYRYEPADSVYLTGAKAMMLSIAIDNVLEDRVRSSGVYTQKAYVGVCKRDNGEFLLSIIPLDPNDPNKILGTSVYQFRSEHHFLVNNIKIDKSGSIINSDKEYLQSFELNLLRNILIQFSNAMTYSVAYTNVTSSQRDARLNKLFDIASAVGASSGYGGNRIAGKTSAADLYGPDDDYDMSSGTIDDL